MAKATCSLCESEYGEKDATNHTTTEVVDVTEGNKDIKKHGCCGAVIQTLEHFTLNTYSGSSAAVWQDASVTGLTGAGLHTLGDILSANLDPNDNSILKEGKPTKGMVANSEVYTNGARLDTQTTDDVTPHLVVRLYLPLIDFTQYDSVSMHVKAKGDGMSLTGAVQSETSKVDCVVTYTYNKNTATLVATITVDNVVKQTVEITDTKIINGTKRTYFTVWGGKYCLTYFSQITAEKLTVVEELDQ